MSRRELYRRLERLVAEAVSPDGIITATVFRGQTLRLRLLPRTYTDYTAPELETQLNAVVTAAFRAYREARRDFRERNGLSGPASRDGSGAPPDPAGPRARLAARARDLTAHASSSGDWVRARTRGLAEWRFALADNILGSLSPARFVDEVHAAVSAATANYHRELRLLLGRTPD